MNFDIMLLLPELSLLVLAAALFTASVTSPGDGAARKAYWLPWASLAVLGVCLSSLGARGVMFHGTYVVDGLSQLFKAAIAAGFTITSLFTTRARGVDDEKRADYLMFLAFSAWGLMLLSSAAELMTLYVAMEISSYSLYAVIPLRAQNRNAAEAGVKYIMFGAMATALALFGYSYILAAQGTGYVSELAGMDWSFAGNPAAAVGLILFLCGVLFKLALFPFHFWAPDVYQGTGNETAAFAATLPKLGAAAVLVRLAALLAPNLEITFLLALFAAASMTLGNLAALAQKDLKRMLGYSGIAHSGYLVIGLAAGTAEGLGAMSFYAIVYLLMNMACFWVVCHLRCDGKNPVYDDLNGLSKNAPGLALVLAVSAFALVGLPPTAGFMGKLFLLTSAWNHGYAWLVIVAVVNTALAIFYYLSLFRHAYTAESDGSANVRGRNWMGTVAGTAMAAAILILGALPGGLYRLALEAGSTLLP